MKQPVMGLFSRFMKNMFWRHDLDYCVTDFAQFMLTQTYLTVGSLPLVSNVLLQTGQHFHLVHTILLYVTFDSKEHRHTLVRHGTTVGDVLLNRQ